MKVETWANDVVKRGMWYGWNTHPVTDSETFLSKGWFSRSVLGACVCVHLCGSRHHPVPLTPTRYPLLLSLALSSPLPLQYLISSCAGRGNTHTFCFSACWLSSSILLCLLCVLLPLQPMSPSSPMGFVGQPGYLTIPAAVKGVERSDTTLLPSCRSASLLLYAFRLTLCFAG